MKRFYLFLLAGVIFASIITSTSAVYQKSFELKSGDIISKEIEGEENLFENEMVFVKSNLNMKKSFIYGNVACFEGPVNFQTGQGNNRIEGYLKIPNEFNGRPDSKNVTDGIIQEDFTFPNISFDYNRVPNDIEHKGDFNHENYIDESGRYNNFVISSKLTVNTRGNDIYIIVNSNINFGNSIDILGNGRLIFIAKSNINLSGSVDINQSPDKLVLVVEQNSLNLQARNSFKGHLYFEGSGNLNIINGFEFNGIIFAPSGHVRIQNGASLNGNLLCDRLSLDESNINPLN